MVIVAVAALLRCLFLSKESLWLDECASWSFAHGDLGRALRSETTNPPLYYVLLHLWIRFFGTSEAAMRALSIPPGIIAIWVIHRLARSMFSNRVALLAAMYLAISTFHIFYSQEARTFSWLALLILVGSWQLWEAVRGDGARWRWIAYAVTTTSCLYSHYISVFFVAGQAVFLVLEAGRSRRAWLPFVAAAAAATASFGPWIARMLGAAAGGGQPGRRHLLLKLPQSFFSFAFGDSLIPLDERAVRDIPGTLSKHRLVLAVILVTAILLLPFARSAWVRSRAAMRYALVMCVVPVLLTFGVSLKLMMFDERYLISASTFLYLVVAAAVAEVWKRTPGPTRTLGVAAAASYATVLAISLHAYYFDPRIGKEQWREAIAYIDAGARAGDADVILFEPGFLRLCYDYYSRRPLPYVALDREPLRALASDPARLSARIGSFERLWFIRSHAWDDHVLSALRQISREQSRATFPKGATIDVFLFRGGGTDDIAPHRAHLLAPK